MASRHLPHVAGRDIAFCFRCHNEWYHPSGDASALQCDLCLSDCIELVSQSDANDARNFLLPTPFSAANPPPGIDPFGFLRRDMAHDAGQDRQRQQHDHTERDGRYGAGYGDDGEDSDPGVADIDEQEFHDPGNYDMYRSTFTFHPPSRNTPQHGDSSTGSRSHRGSDTNHGPGSSSYGQRPRVTDPSDPTSIISSFTNFLTGYRDSFASRPGGSSSNDNEPPSRSRTTRTSDHGHRTTSVLFPGGATSFTIATGPIPRPPRTRPSLSSNTIGAGPLGDFESFFTNMMGDTSPPDLGFEQRRRNQAEAGDGLTPDLPAAMHQILLSLLHQPQGDVVHTNEAMDLVMSMLMETSPGSGAAPPATEQALDQLERKKIDAEMLGPEGSAECTICIAEVNLGEEVLSLTCKHWFHEECALMWLKQHNTCPVCRRPVEAANSGSAGDTHGERESERNQASNQPGNSSDNHAGSGGSGGSNGASGAEARSGTAGSQNTNPSNTSPYVVNGRFFMMNLGDLRNAATAHGATASASARAAAGENGSESTGSGQGNSQAGSEPGWPLILPPMLRLRRPDAAAEEQGQPWGQPWAWQSLWHQQQTDQQERARRHREQVRTERQENEQHRDRPDAIRIPGLPPNNHYRSSRTPERASAAERERRRRDSYSPNPGHNIPSRRYNNGVVPPIAEDYWSRGGREHQASESRPRSPSSVSTGHYYWRVGGLDGSGDELGRERFVDRYTRDRDRERQRERERERDRPDRLDRSRISSILNTEPTTPSYGHGLAPSEPGLMGLGPGDEGTDGNRNTNSSSRRSGGGSGSGGFFGSLFRGLSGGSSSNNQSSNARGRS